MVDPRSPEMSQPAPTPSSLNMGRSLAQIVLILVVILVLVNLPVNAYGFGLAHLLPNTAPPVVHDGLPMKGSGSEIYRLETWEVFFRPLGWVVGAAALLGGAWALRQYFRIGQKASGLDPQLESYLAQALTYKTQIDQLFKTTPSRSRQGAGPQLPVQINRWIETIQRLVQHLDRIRRDTLIQQDLLTVPQAIAALETQLGQESDPLLRPHLERTLLHRYNQLASLELLQYNLKQVEIQLESTLSQLGAVYSQLLSGHTTRHLANYQRLSLNVDEEVQRLQDYLEALQEVKSRYWIDTR